MRQLAERGYRLGLRFDPLLYTKDYQRQYRELFEAIFSQLEVRSLHSVSFGPFRMPRDYFQRMHKLYPEEKLFAGLDEESRMVLVSGGDRESHARVVRGGAEALRAPIAPVPLSPVGTRDHGLHRCRS